MEGGIRYYLLLLVENKARHALEIIMCTWQEYIMADKGKSDADIKAMYKLVVELHNKVTDSLNHLAYEKESLEDAADALTRVRKMTKEMDEYITLFSQGSSYDPAQMEKFKQLAEKFDRELSNYTKSNKKVFDAATDFAQQWNVMEEELGKILESNGKKMQPPPYIR